MPFLFDHPRALREGLLGWLDIPTQELGEGEIPLHSTTGVDAGVGVNGVDTEAGGWGGSDPLT